MHIIHILDLFSGSDSIKKYCAGRPNLVVTSVDSDPRCKPDICTDILKWDFKAVPPKRFDVIWASPPCQQYSQARRRSGPPDIQGANTIVRRVLNIIKYLNPSVFVIENPQTGLLKDQSFMRNLPYQDVSYCQYGFPWRKQTRLWTNLACFQGRTCQPGCRMMVDGKHRSLQDVNGAHRANVRAIVPPRLIGAVMKAAISQCPRTRRARLCVHACG